MLERQPDVGQEVLDRAEEARNWMAIGCRSQILGRHVEIELRAGDESMAEQVADGDESHARAHEV